MIFKELHIYFSYNKEDRAATRMIKDEKGNIIYQQTCDIFSNAFQNSPVRVLEEYLSEYSAPEQCAIEKVQQTKQWTINDEMQLVKEGQKPPFIGFSLTQEQFDELGPYVKDERYLDTVLASRVPTPTR